jgi:hypothetical protein
MTSKIRFHLVLLMAFFFLVVGCITTETASRESRHKRGTAPDRDTQETAAAPQLAPVKPVVPKTVFEPAQKAITVKTVQLGTTPIYATIPENWQVKEDTAFRFSLSARNEGNVIVRTVVNEKKQLPYTQLLWEGSNAAEELPRPLVLVKSPAPGEPFKQGNIWYREATYKYKRGGSGRLIRALHIMNAKGTMRAHAFMYSLNDDNLPGLRKVAESITFK